MAIVGQWYMSSSSSGRTFRALISDMPVVRADLLSPVDRRGAGVAPLRNLEAELGEGGFDGF